MLNKRALMTAVCVSVMLFSGRQAGAQTIDPAFRADIETLLTVTDASAMAAQMAKAISGQMIDGMKRAQPGIPDRAVAIIKEVLDAEFAKAFDGPGSIREKLVVIYATNMSPADVKGLIAFYGTPLGKKLLAVTPVISQGGAMAGQEWITANLPRIQGTLMERLKAAGI